MTDLLHVLRLATTCLVVGWVMVGCGSHMDPPPTGSPGGGGGSGGTSGLDQDAQGTVDATPSFEAGECPGPVTGDLPCEIAAVLAICQSCHRNPPIRGAPFSFMSYEDTQAVYFGSERRWQRMAKVIEPTAPLHMPPRTETDIPQLTDAQLNTLRAWFVACAPPLAEGAGCDKGE